MATNDVILDEILALIAQLVILCEPLDRRGAELELSRTSMSDGEFLSSQHDTAWNARLPSGA